MSEEGLTPYLGYDVLDKQQTQSWDDLTRAVIQRRLAGVPGRRFFNEHEWRTVTAVADRIVPQGDRSVDFRILITPWIDDAIARGTGDGFRHAAMPPLQTAWRCGLQALDDEARQKFGHVFSELDISQRDAVLSTVESGEVASAQWHAIPPRLFFNTILVKSIVGVYYAHPTAWSEVGFGGPASPRGYVRLGLDKQDEWEAQAHP